MLTIIIGYHEDTGEAIDGTVVTAADDREACRKALDWVAHDTYDNVGGWEAYEYLPSWGPGRKIPVLESDFS